MLKDAYLIELKQQYFDVLEPYTRDNPFEKKQWDFFTKFGEVEVNVAQDDGESVVVANLGPGEVFGEISLIKHQPTSATVAARGKLGVLYLNRDEFQKVLDEKPEVKEYLEGLSEDRVKDTLEYLDWFPLNVAPVVGPTIQFLSKISDIIATVTDIISEIGKFIPTLGDSLNVTASSAALTIGQSTTLAVAITVNIATDLCKVAGGSFVDKFINSIKDKITKRIASSVPGLSSLFNYYDYSLEDMDWATGYLYEGIGSLAGET